MSIVAEESATVDQKSSTTSESLTLKCKPAPGWPEWFRAEQEKAWEEFLATPMPTRRDEAWRFADIKALNLAPYKEAPQVVSEGKLINASQGLDRSSARFIFGNNTLLHRQVSALPEGVIVKPLEQAAHEDEELFRRYFMSQPVELGSHKFALLHKALLRGGILVHVPKNTEVALPIEIFHWVEGVDASVFPHTLIVLGENSSATVVDYFQSADGARALACGINDFHLARGARLTYAAVQDWSRDTLAFHLNSTHVERDANSTALIANLGGGMVRGESLSKLAGEGSRSVMLSLNPMDGTRRLDQRTLQDHAAKNASSDLLYRNALDDQSQTIFSGLIRVEPGSSGTDAYQKVENLTLSDDAVAYSMPGLQILNDDVRCTHGATTGGLSEEELFYMQARGIPAATGRRLIVKGFFDSLLERIEVESVREYISQRMGQRLGVI